MKKNNIQMTGVATATATINNGNGNGSNKHKTEESAKPKTFTADNPIAEKQRFVVDGTTYVEHNIPITTRHFAIWDEERIIQVQIEQYRLWLSEILKALKIFGQELYMNEADGNSVGGIIEVLSQIGEGLTEALEISQMKYEKLFESKPNSSVEKSPTPLSSAPNFDSESSRLAKQISDLLANPNLPDPLREGLLDALTNTFNEHIDQSEFREYEKSPEHIAKILQGYHKKNPGLAA